MLLLWLVVSLRFNVRQGLEGSSWDAGAVALGGGLRGWPPASYVAVVVAPLLGCVDGEMRGTGGSWWW